VNGPARGIGCGAAAIDRRQDATHPGVIAEPDGEAAENKSLLLLFFRKEDSYFFHVCLRRCRV
jgi:hypothetical protein